MSTELHSVEARIGEPAQRLERGPAWLPRGRESLGRLVDYFQVTASSKPGEQ